MPIPSKSKINATLQARLCESSNHWAMAAMIWRKLGENDKADACELILNNAVNNPNFKLEERAPVVLKLGTKPCPLCKGRGDVLNNPDIRVKTRTMCRICKGEGVI